MYLRTSDEVKRTSKFYPLGSSSYFEAALDPTYTLGEGDPLTKHRILIFYGYSGWDEKQSGVNLSGTLEKDGTHFVTALTLKKHLIRRFPSDEIEIICAWHKNIFINALMTPSTTDPNMKIRQIHYIGHGNQGGLYFGYKNKAVVQERMTLNNLLQRPVWLFKFLRKRNLAFLREASLLSGFFTDGLTSTKLSQIQAQMATEALMHIWGCFAGARQHTFDTSNPYWNLFNNAGTPVDGIAKHIAKSLKIQVTAVYDPDGIHGTDFCIRDGKTNKIGCPNTRRLAIPTWPWPLSPKVRWITYDAAGNGDETSINFLGTRRSSKDLAPGIPPKWLTNEIPKVTAKLPAFPACSPAYVSIK